MKLVCEEQMVEDVFLAAVLVCLNGSLVLCCYHRVQRNCQYCKPDLARPKWQKTTQQEGMPALNTRALVILYFRELLPFLCQTISIHLETWRMAHCCWPSLLLNGL